MLFLSVNFTKIFIRKVGFINGIGVEKSIINFEIRELIHIIIIRKNIIIHKFLINKTIC